MQSNAEVVLRRSPSAAPVADDFELVARPKPTAPLRDGLLVRVIAVSLDPYMGGRLRGRHMGEPAPAPGESLPGFAVAEVLASDTDDFRVGDFILAETGWRHFAAIPAAGARKLDPGVPLSAYLGVLGMPGLTGWAGVTQLAKVTPDDVFVVDAAAGPVGGTAGQIARNLGARVVGIAGGPAKCALVNDTYGFDACVDSKQDCWGEALRTACGSAPTVHFESVGLSVLTVVAPMLANCARVVLCGLAEHYHDTQRAMFPIGDIVGKRAAFLGLVVYDFYPRQSEWTALGSAWLKEGRLTMAEDAAPDLAAAPAQFEKLMRGENIGKALVRIGPERL